VLDELEGVSGAMRQVAAYTEIRAPRWGKEEHEYVMAKSRVPYAYSTGRNASLIHKISYLRLRWWTCGPGGEYLVRLQSPTIFAVTNCQQWLSLNGTKARSCAMPRPDAVMCARCHGEGVNFPRGREHKIPRNIAKVKLGCIAEASR
jgi:hypothetical protein